MNRTFYFLKDSVTGRFYTGQSNYIDNFDKAAVYFQRKNAEKKIKDVLYSWDLGMKHIEKYTEVYLSRDIYEDVKAKIDQRKDLPNWGIEVVEIEVSV